MFEKVNPCHPDKVADRIAGAIVDLAYQKSSDPKVAVEVLLGHGICTVILETSVDITEAAIDNVIRRIAGNLVEVRILEVPQDEHLASNQEGEHRCGDNGIFKGSPVTEEQKELIKLAKKVFDQYPSDGKYLIANGKVTVCQSNASREDLSTLTGADIINPLGDWTGGPEVDCGATNRKLGSDMGDGVTGGGLHGKDLTKADVTINIYLHLLAQRLQQPVYAYCSIGDESFQIYNGDGEVIRTVKYQSAINSVQKFINKCGGFEKLAEWGILV